MGSSSAHVSVKCYMTGCIEKTGGGQVGVKLNNLLSSDRIKNMDHQILNENPKLADIVDRLIKTYRPLEIYLFGSTARGEYGPHSDYDLLVVVPDHAEIDKKKPYLAYKALRGTGIAVDIAIWTKSEFDKRLHLKASLPSVVKDEGKLLYAA